jgi:hypothetical protein
MILTLLPQADFFEPVLADVAGHKPPNSYRPVIQNQQLIFCAGQAATHRAALTNVISVG